MNAKSLMDAIQRAVNKRDAAISPLRAEFDSKSAHILHEFDTDVKAANDAFYTGSAATPYGK
jgi:hypothetical protein